MTRLRDRGAARRRWATLLTGTALLCQSVLFGAAPASATGPLECGYLRPGQELHRGATLATCNGKYTLVHGTDGNVVLWRDGRVAWQTGTSGAVTSVLTVAPDGNVVLFAPLPDGGPIGPEVWSSGTRGQDGASLHITEQYGSLLLLAPHTDKLVKAFTGTIFTGGYDSRCSTSVAVPPTSTWNWGYSTATSSPCVVPGTSGTTVVWGRTWFVAYYNY